MIRPLGFLLLVAAAAAAIDVNVQNFIVKPHRPRAGAHCRQWSVFAAYVTLFYRSAGWLRAVAHVR